MTRKIKVSAAERRAIRREHAVYKAQHPANPTNEQYFRTQAAAFGCDPNSKAQARVFSQTLNAICDKRRPIIAGIVVDAMFLAKLRHPTKPDPLPAMWAEFQALTTKMTERGKKGADWDRLPGYARWKKLSDGLFLIDATSPEGLAAKVRRLMFTMRDGSDLVEGEFRDKALASLSRSADIVAGKGGAA